MGTPTPDLISPPSPDVSPRRKAVSRPGAFRFSAVELLVAIALLFLATPFVEDLPRGDLLEVALMSVVMVSAVLAVGGQRRTLIVAIVLLVPALAAKWGNHVWPDVFPSEIFLVSGMVFFMFVIARLLRFILRAPRVDANVLCAGISVYLMLGLLWIPAYLLVARISPGAFSLAAGPDAGHPLDAFNAFYFSFITLCTVGYGDIYPVSKVARMLAVVEAITGLFYMAVFISRLVAVYSTTQAPVEDPPPPSQN